MTAVGTATATSSAVEAEELERYRQELLGYTYRMLGSIHEAQDAVQDTMLRAWRGLARFEDRGALRNWLYRIATNVCIDMLRGRARRAVPRDVAPVGAPEGRLAVARPESTWVGPAPDSLVLPPPGDPADHAVARESVRLAFIVALQQLPPRQRAVLILRDVLRWRAAEVSKLLGTSTDAVNSTLRRARATAGLVDRDAAPSEPSEGEREVLAAYIDAFERQDVDALVRLLRDDAVLQMPPFELWLRGKEDIRRWLIGVDAMKHHFPVPVNANGSPAVAVYVPRMSGGPPTALAIHVLEVVDGRISVIHAFVERDLFALFGLPLEAVA